MATSTPVDELLLATIRTENLNVYRASPQRLREDVGQENQIAQDYRGRLIYELLQNADDAMAHKDAGDACIRFMLTDDALWVGNSGQPLNEADVRGLCGISASSKVGQGEKRRATIGHKGMGFKSVLEITEAPEVYSSTVSFRFGPDDALGAVRCLVDEGKVVAVTRAPLARFPWPVDQLPSQWVEMRACGMRTAFCFPLRAHMTVEQRSMLAEGLINLPVTTLLFLKHFHRVEFTVWNDGKCTEVAWTVTRECLTHQVQGSDSVFQTGVYRVVLRPDQGDPQEFLLAHDGDIPIGGHRGGLDEFAWEGVEYTEVSVAARLLRGKPIPLSPEWRKLHVFLPSGEPCPYDLLVSGAFGSNLSRQEIRIEPDECNYNRFLLRQAARLLREQLLPALLVGGASEGEVLRLLDRGVPAGAPAGTVTAQALYEEVRDAIQELPFVPREAGPPLAPISCVVPTLVPDARLGRDFRAVLPADATFEGRTFPRADLCGSDTARVLVDHGAKDLESGEAAAVLSGNAPERSRAWADTDRGVDVDPVLSVLERLWEGLDQFGRSELVESVRQHPLCPVSIGADRAVHRIRTEGLECFYPPRALSGEVPLDRLCFLARDLCWGALNPKERNILLEQQMEVWQGLFGIRDFKFPDVMRASVLPALELERSPESERTRDVLHDCDCLAAICQLAGRTPNPIAPLPYERLGPNRALYNLSRLDVPCRRFGDDKVAWIPAYRVYFGDAWINEMSIERVLRAGETTAMPIPDVHLLLGPHEFAGLLDRYGHLDPPAEEGGIGEDEVGLDEDEDAALDSNDQARWHTFFSWLGVNSSLRSVHFHDVEDRASGWLSTKDLRKPEGQAFQKIPASEWEQFVNQVRHTLEAKDLERFEATAPYFYRLHDLEHLDVLLRAAARDSTAKVGRALYEHLAVNWGSLDRFARLQVAQVTRGLWPGARSKPARAQDHELGDAGDNFWVRRLQLASFCPTGHGPRSASEVWPATFEVKRRFGHRSGQYLVPVLEVEPVHTKGRARGFAQALGIREELTPASYTVNDAGVLLARLETLYWARLDDGSDLRSALREVIRPAYRQLIELLSSRGNSGERPEPTAAPLADAPILAQDGDGAVRFIPAREAFYADRRETRDRLRIGTDIRTFVIEASPGAPALLRRVFGMRTLEESLEWSSAPGELSLSGGELEWFRRELWDLGPYLLARVGAERADDRLVREDARRLRRFLELVEPVTHLTLSCTLDGQSVGVAADQRQAYVDLGDDRSEQALVVWGEHPWPPDAEDAEALAAALCEIFGASYFESFLALIQAGSPETRDRLLRRAGAPWDVEERRAILHGCGVGEEKEPPNGPPDIGNGGSTRSTEDPPPLPDPNPDGKLSDEPLPRTPLLRLDELLVDGVPVLIAGKEPPTLPASKHGSGLAPHKRGISIPHGGGYGGRTDLGELDALGMSIALAYERNRLRRANLGGSIFDPQADAKQPDALVFDVSSPALIVRARELSPVFDQAMRRLQVLGVSPEWPGFDILSFDPSKQGTFDRLIELKSSGVDARMQDQELGPLRVLRIWADTQAGHIREGRATIQSPAQSWLIASPREAAATGSRAPAAPSRVPRSVDPRSTRPVPPHLGAVR